MPAPQQSNVAIFKDTSGLPRPRIDQFRHDYRDSAGYALAKMLKVGGSKIGKLEGVVEKRQEEAKQQDDAMKVAHAQLGLDDINTKQAQGNGIDLLTGDYEPDAYQSKRGQLDGAGFGGELRDKYTQEGVNESTDPEAYQAWLNEAIAGKITEARAKGPAYYNAFMKELGGAAEKMSEQAAGHVENILQRDTQKAWKERVKTERAAAQNGTNRRKTGAFLDRLMGTNVAANIGSTVSSTIRGHEGFKTTAYWDVNAYRTGYGSDTYTTKDGKVHKVTKNTVITKADAERDLQRRLTTEFVPMAQRAMGKEWANASEGTKAALSSIAYNYGEIPSRIRSAVRSGNPQAIASAIKTLGGDNKGINRGRRNSEANMVLSGISAAGSAKSDGDTGVAAAERLRAAGSRDWMAGTQTDQEFAKKLGVPIEKLDELRAHLAENAPLRTYLTYKPPKKKEKKGPGVLDPNAPPPPETLDETTGMQDRAGEFGVSEKQHRDTLTEVLEDEITSGSLEDDEKIESEIKQNALNEEQASRVRVAATTKKAEELAIRKKARSALVAEISDVVLTGGDASLLKEKAPAAYNAMMALQNSDSDVDPEELEYNSSEYEDRVDYNDPDFKEEALKKYLTGEIHLDSYKYVMETYEDEMATKVAMSTPAVRKTVESIRDQLPDDAARSLFKYQVSGVLADLVKNNDGERPPVSQILQAIQAVAQGVTPAPTAAPAANPNQAILDKPEYNLGN